MIYTYGEKVAIKQDYLLSFTTSFSGSALEQILYKYAGYKRSKFLQILVDQLFQEELSNLIKAKRSLPLCVL